MADNFHLNGRIWIEGPQGTSIGYGRVRLLEEIRKHGSISAAARAMEMSYRHAWRLVSSMNRQSRLPIVVSNTGGRGGGGATLTQTGEQAITAYWAAHRDFEEFLQSRSRKLGL